MGSVSRIDSNQPNNAQFVIVEKLIKQNVSPKNSTKVMEFAVSLFKEQGANSDAIEICNKIIGKFKGDKKLKNELLHFDRQLGKLKQEKLKAKPHNEKDVHLLKDNAEKLKKWIGYGFDQKLFYKNPDFVDFIFSSALGSQMKIARMKRMKEINGEPALMIEEKWMKASDILKKFEILHDPTYNEKFIVKKGTNTVYTYTDMGHGLVPFHPYKEGLIKPISHLDRNEYWRVLETAQKFVREDEEQLDPAERAKRNKERTCVLQIVSSQVNENKFGSLAKNLYNIIDRKHPWIRLVEPKDKGRVADVYEEGFGWENQPGMPFETIKGRFRSIDAWEYKPAKRIVTNIAITPEELKKMKEFPQRYIAENKPIGFHLMAQNCSVAVRMGVKEATGIQVPTEIGFASLLMRVVPDFFRKFVYAVDNTRIAVRSLLGRVTPTFVHTGYNYIREKIINIYAATVAFRLSLAALILGSGSTDTGGLKIGPKGEEKVLQAPLHRPRYWYDLSLHKFNMPGILQEWQDKQPSTVVYGKDHTQFAIVPPSV